MKRTEEAPANSPGAPTAGGEPQQVDRGSHTVLAALSEDPITGMRWKPDNWQSFSWPWVWLSLGSFVLAQLLMGMLVMKTQTIHGMLLLEALLNLLTYYLGGFMIGVASPKVRVLEPATAAVIAMFLVQSVGMWLPFGFLTVSLIKVIVMGVLVFVVAWTGAVHGERLTHQL